MKQFFHLFGECLLTIKLLVKQWSTTSGLVLPELNPKESMLGFCTTKGSFILENHVLLISKMSLYRNKQNPNAVSFSHFRLYLRQIYAIEYTIPQHNGSLAWHYSKWDPLTSLLQQMEFTKGMSTVSPGIVKNLAALVPCLLWILDLAFFWSVWECCRAGVVLRRSAFGGTERFLLSFISVLTKNCVYQTKIKQ